MEMCRDVDRQSHRPASRLETREGCSKKLPHQRSHKKVRRLQHYYGLEDILPEEEFKKAMRTCAKFAPYDGREWYLPEEIWERIMRKAQFQDLLCWRGVCKRWNLAIVTDKWTSEENKHSQTTIPLIMRCRESSAADVALLALNPDYQKWFRMDIGHALTFLHLNCEDGRKCSPCFQCTSISSLGLLVLTCNCSVHWNSDPCLVVYNPVTKKVKPLIMPQLPAEYIVHNVGYFRLAGVIEGANDEQYKLLFSTVYPNFVESFRVYCVYDSQNSSWKFGRGPVLSLPCIFSKASCGGCFYFLYRKVVHEQRGIHINIGLGLIGRPLSEPCMSKYDSETETWSEIAWLPKHEGADSEHLPQIVQCRGEVLFVARRKRRVRHKDGPYHTWAFFKLDKTASSASKLWKYAPENGSMPYPLTLMTSQNQDAANWLSEDTRCEGLGDKVFFYHVQPCTKHNVEQSSSSDSTGLRKPELMKNGFVMFLDRETRTWFSLPKYYPFQKADRSSVYKLESFRPSFIEP